LKKAVEGTVWQSKINQQFDYSILTDIIREFESSIQISLSLMFSFIIPMFIWKIFSSGGFLAAIQQYPNRAPYTDFWRGGAYYFIRFFRLSIYTSLACLSVLFLAYAFFKRGGLNPLFIESEGPLITKFWLCLIAITLLIFIFDHIKELAKVYIVYADMPIIFTSNTQAAKDAFKLANLKLALINLIVLMIIGFIYFIFRKFSNSAWLIGIILSQAFLVFRIGHRFVKVASLEIHNRTSSNEV